MQRGNAKLELPSVDIRWGSLTRGLDIWQESGLVTPFD
jgi:hypothetical protein